MEASVPPAFFQRSGAGFLPKVCRAAEDDFGQVKGADDGREGDGEALAGDLQDVVGGCLGFLEGRGGLEPAFEERDRKPGFQAAALAALAFEAAVGADHDVADFPGRRVHAAGALAVDHQAGAHAAADLDQDRRSRRPQR